MVKSVLIADDQKTIRQALYSLFSSQEDFDVCGDAENGLEAIEMAQVLHPDLILLDLSMPVMNGFDAVRQLKNEGVTAKIIFLTMHADDRLLAEAFRCGGYGYVLKQSAGEELIAGIRQVLAGRKYVTPLIATEWAEDVSKRVQETQKLTLTPRQREVLQLVVEGCTMKEIATRLGISSRTAESHKYEMMEGLGVDNTAELIQYAIKLGLTSE